ncbi:DUF4271 domain-containing protein [Jiulongibacter sediminis]|uniref:DUF4271 domain-containing protein n=1 Tax=Jiulongibacter sediminis TaxID=1605367 RepID=A0A0P7C2F7_9BACT|nr:DUF4271 domain-containing protein [Jiulongibacter sediminis]KPM47522.1 hypothetical protein AFM12_13525 [Jiulongibacter sediminis]TBX23316.1 hypothetical protein TK44_13535 [Jiulongibacter sediminis]
MYKYLLSLLFSIGLVISPSTSFAINGGPDDAYHIIKSFDKDWLIYNENADRYEPFIDKLQSRTEAHTVFIDLQQYKPFDLLVKSEGTKGYLFVNGQMYSTLKANEWQVIALKNFTGEEIQVSFLGSGNIQKKHLFIGSKANEGIVSEGIARDNLISMKHRISLPFGNSFVIIITLLFLYATVLSGTNPKAFGEYFSVNDLFVTKIRDTKFLISKPLNRINQAFVVLLSITTGLLFVILAGKGLYLFNNPFGLNTDSGSGKFLFAFVLVSLGSYVLYILKYIFLMVMSQLFGIKKSLNIHYFKNIQFMLITFLVLVMVLYIWYVQIPPGETFDSTLIYYILLGCYMLRSVLSYFSILKSSGIQSLYLIAYLCVVEILPIVLGLRLAF